jgi:hypothetical protein
MMLAHHAERILRLLLIKHVVFLLFSG